MRKIITLALLLGAAPVAAYAQDEEVFVLGELQSTARNRNGQAIGGAVLDGETLRTFAKESLDDALDLVPGANASSTGGSRNERLIFVRGFDRFQTTLSIDGVRVFLPADNRIDFSRFLTADLASVQVAKGYVPLIDGPGALGGAINLVTRKPVKDFEAEFRGATWLDQDLDGEAYQVSGLIGGRRGDFYAQVSGAYSDRDHFTLSDKFMVANPALEDGGERGFSATRDWRVNIKGGWTPNDTDEYSLSYTMLSGEKNAPLHVSDAANTRFWTWPYWDLDSLYFLSRTRLSDSLTLRSRLYSNSFDNLLSAFDNATQTTQLLPRGFNSYYSDQAVGGNLELDWTLGGSDMLKAAFYIRNDKHRERQDGNVRTPPAPINPSANQPYSEPWQTTEEGTYSFALEGFSGIGDNLDLTVAASYDWSDLKRAEEVTVRVTGTTIANSVISFDPVNFPLRNDQALNGQVALTWRAGEDLSLHATLSSRARFPTIFERFSARMGTAIPNPDVRHERATAWELGFSKGFGEGIRLEGAVFYADLDDALIQIPVSVPGFGIVNQTKNAASGHYSGGEVSFEAQASDTWRVGGNYTYLNRELIDPTNPQYQPMGVPAHKAFFYAHWKLIEALTLTPSLELASDRWTSAPIVPAPAAPAPNVRFYKIGDYELLNINADWALNERVLLSGGVQNLTDQNYALTEGFPEAGRSYYASVRVRY